MHRLREHCTLEIKIPEIRMSGLSIFFKKRKEDGICASFNQLEDSLQIKSSYYVGADWLPGNESKHWLFVEPKLNPKHDPESGEELKLTQSEESHFKRIDVIRMLFEALSNSEVQAHTGELFDIKFNAPSIPSQCPRFCPNENIETTPFPGIACTCSIVTNTSS